MSKKIYILSFSLIFFIIYLYQYTNKVKEFELIGEVKNNTISKNKIYINYKDNIGTRIVDSALIVKSKFKLSGNIDYPTKVILSNSNKFRLDGINSIIMYLEPKKNYISLNIRNLKTSNLKGSKTQLEYLELLNTKKYFFKKIDSLVKLKKEMNSIVNVNIFNKKRIENLNQFIEQQKFNEVKLNFKFIKANLASYVSIDLLQSLLRKKKSNVYYDTIISLYDDMPYNLKESKKGKELLKSITNYKKSNIGGKAPKFTTVDINNNEISLSNYNGKKYILLDFWASWCSPCRQDFPRLIDLYHKFSKKEFEIINISKDRSLNSWKEAINNDNIEIWKHILITKNNSNIIDDYIVTGIPLKILINKDGYVIGRWRGSSIEYLNEIEQILTKELK